MVFIDGSVAAMLVMTLWALWARRNTFTLYYENAATATLVLQVVAVLLGMPVTAHTLGAWLNDLVGQNNLTAWMSNMCCLASTAAFSLHMMVRLIDHPNQLVTEFRRYVGLPLTFTVPVTLMCLWRSPNANGPMDSLLDAHCGAWLTCYWIVLMGTQLWMLALLFRMLRVLKALSKSPFERHWLRMYCWACGLSALCCLTRLATLAAGDNEHASLMWLFGALSIIVFAYGCGKSWQRKEIQRKEVLWLEHLLAIEHPS